MTYYQINWTLGGCYFARTSTLYRSMTEAHVAALSRVDFCFDTLGQYATAMRLLGVLRYEIEPVRI